MLKLSHTRYAGAVEMFGTFKQTESRMKNINIMANIRRVMAFQKKIFFKANLDDATIIYMCSTCFPPELLEKLLIKFEKINRLGLRIITLKELPDYQKYGFNLNNGMIYLCLRSSRVTLLKCLYILMREIYLIKSIVFFRVLS